MLKLPPRQIFPLLIFILLCLFLLSCDKQVQEPKSLLQRIRGHGRIIMITQNSANTYYLYREQPMGFEYDLAREFARYLGVDLEVITPNWLQMFEMLERGEGDFIAAGVTVVPSRERRVDFSTAYLKIRQQMILPEDNVSIRKPEDLEGVTVHVRAGTSYQESLAGLQGQGIGLKLVLVPDVLTEELIKQVAEGEIEATVADTNIAQLNHRYYPDIRIGFPVSGEQSLAWAVKKGNRDLLRAINEFMVEIEDNGILNKIRKQYYDDRNVMGKIDLKAFHRRLETRLPRFEPDIRAISEEYGFDWRLITAMIYQESHFNPRARSYTGVRGLMQVTLETAEEMGIDNRLDPKQSIEAGVKYLARLYSRFEDIEDHDDRLLFALSSYNVGYGHVRDAQKIARKKNRDPTDWTSVEEVLPLLSRPEYYTETRYGYARGHEPVRYVKNILTYYDIMIGKENKENKT
jgi:membrane-bound lytic murein transglycosylase F